MARAVLEDVRYVLMLKALMLRQKSPFGKTQWQMGWLNAEQELYDLGFQLAELLEHTDQGQHDARACNDLYNSFEGLKPRLEDPGALMNLLACELLLGLVACPLGLKWASECPQIADRILRMLPTVNSSGAEHRSIFPLTCILWQYRDDRVKYVQAEAMMRFIAEDRKVNFVGGNYEVKPLTPKVARDG